MSTYYEILKLQPSATIKEIEATIDIEYNKWRRLVTHHDPAIVEQANQSLRLLEQIRGTLIDPAARDVYDTGLGLKGPMAGLVDPEAILRASPAAVFPGSQKMAHGEVVKAVAEAWTCGKCQTPNRIGLKFCSKCGTQIGRECVKCNQMVAVGDAYCPYCGVDIAREQTRRAAQQQEMEHQKEIEEAARLAHQREIDRQQEEEQSKKDAKQKNQKKSRQIALVVIFFVIIGVFVALLIQQKTYVNKLIGLSSDVEKDIFVDSGQISIQKFVFDEKYLYVYFDVYGKLHEPGYQLVGEIKKPGRGIFDLGEYVYIRDKENFFSLNEELHKTGYTRFNISDIKPSLPYVYCYGYGGFGSSECIYLFTAPEK